MRDFLIRRTVVSPLHTNCYVIKSKTSSSAVVIDPGGDVNEIFAVLHDFQAECRLILLTHGHFDHILALGALREQSRNAITCIHQKDAHYLRDRDFFSTMVKDDPRPFAKADFEFQKEGKYKVDEFEFQMLYTPGHTDGSVCYIFEDCMFTGDTLFKNSVGTTVFGGDDFVLKRTLKRLSRYPGDFAVFPGHEGTTTLADEKERNEFLLEASASADF